MRLRSAAGLVATAGALLVVPAGVQAYQPYPVSFTPFAAMSGTTTSPPGANNFACRPSPTHPNPVVLVHGLGSTMAENWRTISPLLADYGYCVFALTYGIAPGAPTPFDQFGGVQAMEASGQQLGAFIDRVRAATGAAKVDIVGHSEGSLMPDYYVKFLGGAAAVGRYVGMTPLWNGTNLLGLGSLSQAGRQSGSSAGLDAFIAQSCGACEEFLTGSPFLERLNSAGGPAVEGVTYTTIMSRYDELVSPYTSGILNAPNAINHVLQDQCATDYSEHGGVAWDPVAAQDVINALDPTHARKPGCPVVLPGVGALYVADPPSPGPAAPAGAAVLAAGATRASAGAIPYLTVLPPTAVRRRGKVVHGRIRLRAIIGADGLVTKWSIRIARRRGAVTTHKVIAHGTVGATATKTVSAVTYGRRGSKVVYDVTASNAAGGTPTPPQHARIA